MKQEGAQPTTICSQLKMQAPDGKMRLTDVADTAQIQRIIQSVPSPKAEPFKQWLAQVGSERLDETVDPELSIDRDNMTNTELVLNMLAEVAATDISQVRQPEGFEQSAEVAQKGAKTAKAARLQLEKSTGKPVVSKLNAKKLAAQQLESDVVRAKKQLTNKSSGKNHG